ncbi:hypothetical protein AB205_0087660 [Aquarana catesbeiana]|uniref:Uncharacterized protein n=1 Tax=Aquarana catesbeiana TaxID=8400 RepID=A0A2G9QAQ6_AQUCT|nr:hypothetical protein AB205_0085080 [Aquarana catesbeiana]PIO25764.1 hypothetical protein AB205_0087660 [Aquarana catesbeiana]
MRSLDPSTSTDNLYVHLQEGWYCGHQGYKHKPKRYTAQCVKENGRKKKEAKEKDIWMELKCQPVQPRKAPFVQTFGKGPELFETIPLELPCQDWSDLQCHIACCGHNCEQTSQGISVYVEHLHHSKSKNSCQQHVKKNEKKKKESQRKGYLTDTEISTSLTRRSSLCPNV